MKTGLRILGLAAVILGLAACGTLEDTVETIIGSDEDEVILEGERIPIMLLDRGVQADAALADLTVLLPAPRVNEAWPQAGGEPSHAMHHLSLAVDPVEVWDVDIGDGSGGEQRLMVSPIVAGGRIFTMDAEATLSAFDAQSGNLIWEIEILPEEEEDGDLGGGIAYADGKIFATTGGGQAIAFEASTGAEIWRKDLKGPVRAAPTVYAGRVFVITVDSQLQALDARDGREIWNHAGIAELASILGYASPAAEGNTLIATYPSGEVFAFRIDSGRSIWSDALISLRRVDAISSLPTIRGQPVIYDNQVYVLSHSGRMVAIDLRTGSRAWEQDLGGIQTPWVAGDFIYVMTNNNELVCIARRNGGIRWVRPLPVFDDPEDLEDPILWSGPVLASDRLIVAGDHGIVAAFSPYDGELLGTAEFSDDVSIAPIVANNTLYFLTDDAELVAYR